MTHRRNSSLVAQCRKIHIRQRKLCRTWGYLHRRNPRHLCDNKTNQLVAFICDVIMGCAYWDNKMTDSWNYMLCKTEKTHES